VVGVNTGLKSKAGLLRKNLLASLDAQDTGAGTGLLGSSIATAVITKSSLIIRSIKPGTKAYLFREGGKILGDLIRLGTKLGTENSEPEPRK